MNWSTRLRRWVRISTPPVRVASMKPTAATVLPAPVACSNQKRRAAPGSSSSWVGSTSSSSSPELFDPVLRLLVLLDLGVEFLGLPGILVGFGSDLFPRGLFGSGSGRSSFGLGHLGIGTVDVAEREWVTVLGGDLLLGDQLGQGAGERVDLVGVEFGAVAQGRRFVADQPLEAEQQREVPAPLERGLFGPGVDLGQRRVKRAAAGGAGDQRLGAGFVEQERLARECRRALDI